jgi:serralysin
MPAYEASLDELADYLTDGYWEDLGGSRAAFDTSSSNVLTVNISGLDATGKLYAKAALEAWEMVADIEFSIVSSASVDITFSDSDLSGAYSTSIVSGSTLVESTVNIPTWWNETPYVDVEGNLDEYAFQTYIHELGHALGLGHQGQYNGGAYYGVSNNFTNDSWMYSVMSYFSQDDNTDVDGSYAYVMSAMMADVVAMQDLYGAAGAGSATWGNTTWGNGSDLGNYMDDIFEGSSNADVGDNTITYTIYDAGGTDIVRLNNYSSNIDFDMRDEGSSSIGTEKNIIHIARGTVIENLQTGSGNDTVDGNGAGNWIRTGDGNDTIKGYNGADILSAGGGKDTVFGGSGNDKLYGFGGNDLLNAGSGVDKAYGGDGADTLYGYGGNDLLNGGAGYDKAYGGDGADTLYGLDGNDLLNGGAGYDKAYGGNGVDTLYGLDGNDLLNGGGGADKIYGGNGVDTLYGLDGNDLLNGGGGADKIFGGNHADTLYGLDGNDLLNGGNGVDKIFDGNGNDVSYGGLQADTITFGSGNDTAWGGDGADTFVFGDSDNTDRIRDFTLGEDTLSLNDDLWTGSKSALDVIDDYASVNADGNTVFKFDSGETLYVSGVSDLSSLSDDLIIV